MKNQEIIPYEQRPFPTYAELESANEALDNIALKFAYKNPQLYLTIVGHLLVMTELIALLTPCVALGIQWMTALCDESATWAILDLINIAFICIFNKCDIDQHCIVKTTH